MPKTNFKNQIDDGKSPFEVFISYLKTQHDYFSIITDESAKMYADKFEECLKVEVLAEKTLEAFTEAEAKAKAKAEAEAKAKAEVKAEVKAEAKAKELQIPSNDSN